MSVHTFKPIAFIVSLVGFLGLLWVNIAVLLGKPAPFEVSFTSIFFVLFPLWAFTIYYLNKTTTPLDEEGMARMEILQKIRYLLGNPPDWAMVLLVAFYGYALYCLSLFMTEGIMEPEYVNGQYQIFNHGEVTVYTEAEYQTQHRLHLQSITGVFLAFFSVSTMVLAPWRRASD